MIEPKFDINIIDQINIIEKTELIIDLKHMMKRFNHKVFESIYRKILLKIAFFSEFIREVDIIVDNILKKGRSEVVICYGKNSELSRILINHNLKKLSEKEGERVEIKTINFNAFINDKEENILNELCVFFDLESEKSTFESSCRAMENYFRYFENDEELDKNFNSLDPLTIRNLDKNKKKRNVKTIYVIFYENIEYLFHKQKQILFYTILEIVNNSKNVIFCGTTSNYNLTTLMEKRIRSRFSQKTFFLDLINKNDIENFVEYLFCYQEQSGLKNKSNYLYEIIKNNNHFDYYLEKCFNFGVSIKEFFFNIKILIASILREIMKDLNQNSQTINLKDIEILTNKYVRNLIYISISNLEYLYKLPKLYITVLSCILKTISKHKEKIIISLMYEEYLFFTRRSDLKSKPMKLEMYKKIVEELCIFGLIHPKRDDKYTFTYELKYNLMDIKLAILKLDKHHNFEASLKGYLNDVI